MSQSSNIDEVVLNLSKCKLIHLSILKKIYYNNILPVMTFPVLAKQLEKHASPRTLRDKVSDLKEWGLIKSADAGVCLMWPAEEIKVKEKVMEVLVEN